MPADLSLPSACATRPAGAAAPHRFPLVLALAVAVPTLMAVAGAAVMACCPSAWDHGGAGRVATAEVRSA